MGTVATLLDEHVSFRCTSVDRIGSPGLHPGDPIRVSGWSSSCSIEVAPSPLPRCSTATTNGSSPSSRRSRRRPGCPSSASRRESPKRTSLGPTKTRRQRPVGPDWCWSARPRSGPRRGGATSTTPMPGIAPAIPTSPGVASPAVPDHWYFYFSDPEWGPAFVKICTYAPYPLWCCANGHEWAKCQLAKAGIGFEALDNGLRSVEDPAAAHRICARLGAGHLRALLARMMAVVPDPLCAHDRCGRVRVVLLHRPARGLRHRGVRPAAPGPGLVRGGHRRPPRPRSSRAGLPARRPHGASIAASTRPPGASPPRSSPATPPPSSRSTTSHRRPRPI